jgi:Lon protease-like protein
MSTLRLFPLNTVLFPGATLDLHVFEPRYRRLVEECREDGQAFGVCLIREGDEAGDPEVMPCEIGTTAEIAEMRPIEGGRYYLKTIGGRRFQIERVVSRDHYITAEVAYLDESPGDEEYAQEVVGKMHNLFGQYVALIAAFSGAEADVDLPDDPIDASYIVAQFLQVADSMKQHLLEAPSPELRLNIELELLRRLIPRLRALGRRKRAAPAAEPADAKDAPFRTRQEQYFGRHFSLN